MFSASSETRERNAPTNANQIRLQTSGIRQEHRPIRYQLPARLSFRQGQEVLRAWAVRHISGTEAEAMLLHSFKLAQRQDAKAWELCSATTSPLLYLRSPRIH